MARRAPFIVTAVAIGLLTGCTTSNPPPGETGLDISNPPVDSGEECDDTSEPEDTGDASDGCADSGTGE